MMTSQQKVNQCKWKDCKFQCNDTSELKKHLEDDHLGKRKPSYACEWEDCNFGERKKIYDLKTHLAIHHRHPSHFCSVCNKGFSRDQELRKHRKSCFQADNASSTQIQTTTKIQIHSSNQNAIQNYPNPNSSLVPNSNFNYNSQYPFIQDYQDISQFEGRLDSIETLTSESSSPISFDWNNIPYTSSTQYSSPSTQYSSPPSHSPSTYSQQQSLTFLANQLLDNETLEQEEEETELKQQDLFTLKRQIDNGILQGSAKIMKYNSPSSYGYPSSPAPSTPSTPSTPFTASYSDDLDNYEKPYPIDDFDEWFNKNPLFATLSTRRGNHQARKNQRTPSHFGLKPSGFIKIFRTMKI